MTRAGLGASTSSNNSSCTLVLCLANTLKLAPPGASVAPSGKLLPGWQAIEFIGSPLRVADDLLCFVQDCLQVLLVLEAFGVDFVDRLGARRARCEPSIARDDFEAANRGAVPRRAREFGDDRLSGQIRDFDRIG